MRYSHLLFKMSATFEHTRQYTTVRSIYVSVTSMNVLSI